MRITISSRRTCSLLGSLAGGALLLLMPTLGPPKGLILPRLPGNTPLLKLRRSSQLTRRTVRHNLAV